MKICSCLMLVFFASASMLSQTLQAPSPNSVPTGPNAANASISSTNALAPDLDRLQTAAEQAVDGISRLHIEKWKANANAKSAAESDADSVRRNLTEALPGMINAARSSPEDLNAEFKLYRNLNALYDVFGTLTEATRVFGQKGEYEAFSKQLQVINSVRRRLGESLEQLTATQQHDLKQMQAQIKDQQTQLADARAEVAEARKEVALAQAEAAKKTAPKKKTVAKKTPAAHNSNPSAPAGNSSSPNGAGSTSTPKS